MYVSQQSDYTLVEYYGEKKVSPILGDKLFKVSMLSGKPETVYIPKLTIERVLQSFDHVVRAVGQYYDDKSTEILHKTRGKGVTSQGRSVTM